MGKHRRAPSARSRLAAALRGGGIAGALVLSVFAGAELFSYTAGQAGAGHAAAIGGSAHARLSPAVSSPASRSTGGPDGAASAPASASRTASKAPPARVDGSEVTAVGDSVMVAATPALDQALPGIYVNALVGRQFYAGLQVIEQLKSAGQLRPVVVVGLGTNGTVTAGEISQLFAEIGPGRRLVLVNTYEARSWEQEVNSTLAAAVASHPDTTALANWYGTVDHRTYLLWPDGIHPQPAGGVAYAKMLRAALEKVASLPG